MNWRMVRVFHVMQMYQTPQTHVPCYDAGFAAQRHYSPHPAALHAGGLRPLHIGSAQRAVSAGGPASRE
jgi:hypothetical protein